MADHSAKMYELITEPQSYIKPFPDYDEVFKTPTELDRKHFLPLVSVDLSVIFDDLDFWLHFVMPIEPLLELTVGYFTEQFHDFYNIDSQYAFRVEDGQYIFEGDYNYFAYESGAIFDAFPEPEYENEIHEDYQLRFDSYQRIKEAFQQYNRLYDFGFLEEESLTPDEDDCCALVTQLGGKPTAGNWGEPPVNKSGTPFRFVGEVPGFHYAEYGTQELLLFYDPDESVALFRTDWT